MMPEIPEMETYKNLLEKSCLSQIITDSKVFRERSINVIPQEFARMVQNAVIEAVERRGKYIMLRLNVGKYLLAHMMLDGRIYLETTSAQKSPGKPYVSLTLNNESVLHFCELGFGYVKLLAPSEVQELVAGLGIDPLSTENSV